MRSHPAHSHCPPAPSWTPQTSLCPPLLVPWPPYLASRNFLRRLGRSWLRRRRNQRSTWRPESPLCLDSSSTSACAQRRGRHAWPRTRTRTRTPTPQRPPALPEGPASAPLPPVSATGAASQPTETRQRYLFGVLAVGQVEVLQGGVGGCPQSRFLLHVQEGSQRCGHVTGEGA